VDTTGAGEGEVTVEVLYGREAVATHLTQQGKIYQASFTPAATGQYLVYVFFDKADVTGRHQQITCVK